jgi:hypothetical protein
VQLLQISDSIETKVASGCKVLLSIILERTSLGGEPMADVNGKANVPMSRRHGRSFSIGNCKLTERESASRRLRFPISNDYKHFSDGTAGPLGRSRDCRFFPLVKKKPLPPAIDHPMDKFCSLGAIFTSATFNEEMGYLWADIRQCRKSGIIRQTS